MPARKPTAVKVLEGTFRPHRANMKKPRPTPGRPLCPVWLDQVAKEIWIVLADQLEQMRVLAEADGQALAMLCSALAEYRTAVRTIHAEGPTYPCTTKTGDTMQRQRPEVAIAQDAWRRAKMMLEQFGLTPAARSRVEAFDKAGQHNSVFAKLAQRRPSLRAGVAPLNQPSAAGEAVATVGPR